MRQVLLVRFGEVHLKGQNRPFFMKKLTVMGMMGHTQGVTSATNPPRKQVMKIYHSEADPSVDSPPPAALTGVHSGLSASEA